MRAHAMLSADNFFRRPLSSCGYLLYIWAARLELPPLGSHQHHELWLRYLRVCPLDQSVAQLTDVAAFTVHFIYSNQSTMTLVTPLLSLSSIVQG